jgi:hypothetical protein
MAVNIGIPLVDKSEDGYVSLIDGQKFPFGGDKLTAYNIARGHARRVAKRVYDYAHYNRWLLHAIPVPHDLAGWRQAYQECLATGRI